MPRLPCGTTSAGVQSVALQTSVKEALMNLHLTGKIALVVASSKGLGFGALAAECSAVLDGDGDEAAAASGDVAGGDVLERRAVEEKTPKVQQPPCKKKN